MKAYQGNSTNRRGGPEHGFTLLEFMSSVVVLGLAMAIFLPMLFHFKSTAIRAEKEAWQGIIKEELIEFYREQGHYPISIGPGQVLGAYWNDLREEDFLSKHVELDEIRYECYDGRRYRLSWLI